MSVEYPIRSISPDNIRATATGAPLLDVTNPRHREALEKLEIAYEATCSDAGFQAYLGVLSHLYLYSPRNVMLIFAQRPDATAVNAYDRWQDAGRQVRKGAQGITIFYPRHRFLEVENEATGEPEKRRILTGFGIGAVFDVKDTDGPLIAPPKPPAEAFNTTEDAIAVDRTVSAFLIGEGLRLEKKAMPRVRGYFDPRKREVALNEDLADDDGKAKTLTHEAAHYIAGDTNGWDGRSRKEFIAEAAAYAALLSRGVDTSEYSLPYLQWWTRQPDMMRLAMPQIALVTKTLIAIMEGERPEAMGEWL